MVWVIGYRGGGGRTLWISMVREALRAWKSYDLQHGEAEAEAAAETKWRDPASAASTVGREVV